LGQDFSIGSISVIEEWMEEASGASLSYTETFAVDRESKSLEVPASRGPPAEGLAGANLSANAAGAQTVENT
jgi:hypothetical protein